MRPDNPPGFFSNRSRRAFFGRMWFALACVFIGWMVIG